MKEVLAVQSATSIGEIEPVRTSGSARIHKVSERRPWRAMFGGIGEEKSRSQLSTIASISLMSTSRK